MKKNVLIILIIFQSLLFAKPQFKNIVPIHKIGIGVDNMSLEKVSTTTAKIKYYLNKDLALEFNAGFTTTTGNIVTYKAYKTFKIGATLKLGLYNYKKIHVFWGPTVDYFQTKATIYPHAFRTDTSLGVKIGAEYFVLPNFSLEGCVVPASIVFVNTSDDTNKSSTSGNIISVLTDSNAEPFLSLGFTYYF